MNEKLRLYMTAPCSEVLGPYKRFIVWVQGCHRRCRGCIAKDSWALDGGESVAVDTLVRQIVRQEDIEGLTISGGEPFLQQDALCALIGKVREQRDIGVIIYTGMSYSEIKETSLARNADLIVDGAYIEELNDNKSLRGSANQNIVCITNRYKDLVSRYYGVQGRRVELVLDKGTARMIGIPSKEFKQMIGE